jgi:hypothetical protein
MTWAFMFGAGDENRTPALSLGITDHCCTGVALSCKNGGLGLAPDRC